MIEIYAKRQRAKRKDPQQEAIVAEKDAINERTKKLIALMIAMKKGWNGGPSQDLGVDKFNLTQPIPDIVVGTGDALVHELSDVVQTLHKLKSMQDSYSLAHGQRSEALNKLKEQKQEVSQQQTAPTTQQQISAAVEEELRKIASNPITRIWTHLTAYNPFASEKNRGYRLSLLRSLARVDNSLIDIEDKILSQNESSIFDSIYIAKQLYSDAKSSFFVDFRKNIDNMLSDASAELDALELENKNKPKEIEDENDPAPIIGLKNPKNPDISVAVDNAKAIVNEQPPIIEEDGLLSPGVRLPKDDSVVTNVEPETQNQEIIDLEEKSQKVQQRAEEREQKSKERKAERERKKQERENARADKLKSKVKVTPVKVPVAPLPQSDFIDSDFEAIQMEKYEKILEYVFKHVDSLIHECLSIANSNLPRFWKIKIRTEAKKAHELAVEIADQISKHQDFDMDYGHFLEFVGVIRSMAYVAETETKAAENDPEFVSGSLFNESEIKSQAIKFANEQFGIFMAMSQKVSQANVASRFIKRMITHIMPRRDKNLRLTISRNIRNARSGLQKLLDILEQRNVDFRRLMDAGQEFFESVSFVYEGLADLGDMYNSTMRMEKSVRKQQNAKMPYDMIPTMDINSLRMIGKSITNDIFNINKLEKLEDQLSGWNNQSKEQNVI